VQLRKFARSRYWYVVGRDSEGRRYCKSTKQTDRAAAARAARAIELANAVPRLQPFALSQALVALTEHKRRKKVSAAELEIVATKGARLLEHFGPGRDCNALTAQDIDRYLDARRSDGAADSTIRKELGKLYEALKLGKRNGRCDVEIETLRTDALEHETPRSRWLTHDEFSALLAELPVHRADYVLVWCHTGARYSELFRIEAQHIDHDGRRLWLEGHKGSQEHRERWAPLSDAAYDALCVRAELAPAGPIFPPWPKPNVRVMLSRACRRAGIEPVTPNDLRRTYVTWHLTAGTTEREVQRYVGHSPRSTLVRRVYGQLAADSGRTAVATFPGAARPVGAAGLAAGLADSEVSRRTSGPSADDRGAISAGKTGDPNEIRTRVTGVRGREAGKTSSNIRRLRSAG